VTEPKYIIAKILGNWAVLINRPDHVYYQEYCEARDFYTAKEIADLMNEGDTTR
jgi:hypothetical protein